MRSGPAFWGWALAMWMISKLVLLAVWRPRHCISACHLSPLVPVVCWQSVQRMPCYLNPILLGLMHELLCMYARHDGDQIVGPRSSIDDAQDTLSRE